MVVTVVDQTDWTAKAHAHGIRPGATVTVLAKEAHGARLIRVGDARISLAKQICRAIHV